MARNKETPLTFNLPDGDSVQLVTWEFILNQLNDSMSGVLAKMEESNGHLDEIAKRLEEFVEDQEGL